MSETKMKEIQPVVRLSKSCVGKEEAQALVRVIDAGYLGMGRDVQAFEEEIRAYLQTEREVICVNTGTAALHLALCGLDIGPGDEVLVPTLTYVASFQAVSATGAKPVACDVTEERGFLDISDAERRVTSRTRAIMPVHYASNSVGLGAVYDFARKHGLRVVEDAAHAFGGEYDGLKVGAGGDVVCFSFDGIKNITSGEGGAVVTGDTRLAQRIRDARLLGVEKDTEKRYSGQRSWEFEVTHQGFRYHMSNLMAAIGREQLKKLPAFAAHRCQCVARYIAAFNGVDGIRLLDFDHRQIVPHIFCMRVVNGKRDALLKLLRDQGIECGVHYQPNHKLEFFRSNYSLPVAERLAQELISLPLHSELSEPEQMRVVSAVLDFMRSKCA